ncbi:2-oxo acid dehydrogenase subunit E2 [Bythopirellula goksoeyrii]|uniref:Dihydrolipoamide acetyltransferase component of pyruvate dehydrogenase complex n=1 Tax=Bythopirellula goksoeyrii TaxID=1400387 RepID=A0A5B9QJP1_9BACT|nr:2-oxo acid dehydrogenase subunit E2 [Bythopirellula goksoeyrii]QEG37800.1 Dihydrolipoyllysine-residue acetyltransferase component of pyruvate dehydrogenase complex [Bythopirellula goksoeyrii]
MATQIKLPHLGEKIESGDVLSILVAAGDTVTVDQDLIEVETDKATMPIPSPEAGKVTKVLVSEGDTVEVGAPILEIEAGEGSSNGKAAAEPAPEVEKPAKKQAPPEPKPETSEPETSESDIPPAPETDVPTVVEPESVAKAPPKPAPVKEIPATAGDGHAPAAAGPAVRRLARELGVDLRRVRPASGGRITEEDVRVHVRASNAQAASSAAQGVTPPGTPDSDGHGAVRREKMSRLRQTIARNMFASYSTIPQLTNFDDVDVTELERIRKDSKDDYASQGVKLTSMPFLVKAIATALKQHPIVNASVSESGDEIIYKEYVNIGIAVDTEKGLIVPVLRDADRKSIPSIAREMAKMAEAARDGTFVIEDLRGGTFTISNLGAVGGTYSTPIINPPEVAILLVGRSRTLPMYVKESLEPRLIMPLSITYDHRVVDGAAAARFLNDVKRYLANPGRLLLAP